MSLVAPSLLACNFLKLEEECKMVNESEADWFHLDVMDGQFIPYTLEKIRQLRSMIDEKKLNVLIEIDGGVTVDNASEIMDAGADVLVAGNTVFSAADPIQTIKQLKEMSR